MKRLALFVFAMISLTTNVPSIARESSRFAPLKADELTPAQKTWADLIAAPPRNAKFVNPPYRAYIRNPELAPHLSSMKGGLDPRIAAELAAGKRSEGMKDDEAALYDLASELYRDKKVSDPVFKAALDQFGERGIMDVIGIIGYYDLVSMTLITMQAGAPNGDVAPLPALTR